MSIPAASTELVEAEAEAEGGQPRRRGYAAYVGFKVLGSIGSFFFMLVVNFFLFRVLPGDPARTLGRGRLSTPAQVAAFNKTYGLGESTPRQFLTFLHNTFTGQLGISVEYHEAGLDADPARALADAAAGRHRRRSWRR